MKIAHLVLATVLGLVGADERRLFYDLHVPPAWPAVPPIPARGEAPPVPSGGFLYRNGSAADRFGAEGQKAVYTFEAEPGEFSLFEVECFGMSRGWAATVAVRVLDASGAVLAETERAGGTTFGTVLPFTSPARGTFRLELEARAQAVRFVVVRHSDHEARRLGDLLLLDGVDEAFGFLAARGDEAHYAVVAPPGERVVVTVLPLREPHQGALFGAREALVRSLVGERRQGPGVALRRVLAEPRARQAERGGERGEAGREGREGRESRDGRGATFDTPWPGLVVPVEDGPPLPPTQRLELVADAENLARFAVVRRDGDRGGLFHVTIDRAPVRAAVRGRVGDESDDPLAGVEVHFLLQPTLDLVESVVSASDGTFEVRLPHGDYSVLTFDGASRRVERVLARIGGDQELNLVRSVPPLPEQRR
jgi:hypothetical protein